MWIPDNPLSRNQSKDIELALTTAADALELAGGMPEQMRQVYGSLVAFYKDGVPMQAKVSTQPGSGMGCPISPVQAYLAHKHGMLSESMKETSYGWGSYDVARTFGWRVLDTTKLYHYLADDSLPRPVGSIE